MHEFAIAQDIVSTIRQKVTPDLHRITHINIDVGKFSGVVAESLDFGIKALFAESSNKGVQVNISEIPTIARCECGGEYEVRDIFDSCSVCHSYKRKIIKGMDIFIQSVELEEETVHG